MRLFSRRTSEPPSSARALWQQRRVPPLAALLVAVGVLLVFNLSNWRFLRLLENAKRNDLVERLDAAAQTAAVGLVSPTPPAVFDRLAEAAAEAPPEEYRSGYQPDPGEGILLEGLERNEIPAARVLRGEFAESAEREALSARMLSVQRSAGLAQVALLTTSGLVIADSSGMMAPGDAYRFRELDEDVIDRAMRGRSAATRLYPIQGELYMRLYAPVRYNTKQIGLLAVSINPTYQEDLEALRGQVIRQWLISSVLLLALGYSVWRLFRYLVRVEERAMLGVRVDAMGALAGAVAHELRNPLSIIRVLSEEVAAGDAGPQSREAQNARDIITEIDRLNQIISHFLSLARAPGSGEVRTIDVGQEVVRVVALLNKGDTASPDLPPEDRRVWFEADVPANPVFIRAEERSIRQVLLNLLLNAKEATEGRVASAAAGAGGAGGAAGAKNNGSGPPRVAVSVRERRGNVLISVVDDGPGFDRRVIARAFEPFFTTKPMGSGLGLSVTRGIVETLDGSISLGDAPGRGAEVVVTIPAVREEAGGGVGVG